MSHPKDADPSRYYKSGTPPINCRPELGPTCLPPQSKAKKPRGPTAIDLFAGAGGFTEGAEQAGVEVVWAINHAKLAVVTHAINHPNTAHCCEDVFEFDWREAPTGFDILLASPSCKVHSPAATGTRGVRAKGHRGAAPHLDRLRATPEAVRAALEAISYGPRLPFIVVENVTQFRDRWKGYRGWKVQIEDMGYTSSEVVIEATDLGVASDRRRLFVVFTPQAVSRAPLKIKAPRKRKPKSLNSGLKRDYGRSLGWVSLSGARNPKEWIPADSVIRFARANKRRITERMNRKVPEYWTFTTTTDTNPRLPDQQQRTITHKMGNQLYVVHSKGKRDWIRQVRIEELRAWMGFPASYKLPNSIGKVGELLGNSVSPPVSKYIIRQLIERA